MLTSTLFTLLAIIVILFGGTVYIVSRVIKNQPVHDEINRRLEAGEALEDINKSLGRK